MSWAVKLRNDFSPLDVNNLIGPVFSKEIGDGIVEFKPGKSIFLTNSRRNPILIRIGEE